MKNTHLSELIYMPSIENMWRVWQVGQTVIVIESIIKPMKLIVCCGTKDDFSGCTVNPRESNNLTVSLTFLSQSSPWRYESSI